MNHTLAIVLQVLGYECMLAMMTTIRIENVFVFDVPFPVRAVIGIIGMALVLVGAFGFRRSEKHESKPKTQPNKSLKPTGNKPSS